MNPVRPEAAAVLARARAGDMRGAIAAGEVTLAGGVADAPLALFVGMLCCRSGDLARGIIHLRQSVLWAPQEIGARVELGRALLAAGQNAEAADIAGPASTLSTPPGREMQRIWARALISQGIAHDAAGLFGALVEADTNDFESWDGLGSAQLSLGDVPSAISAFERATGLRPAAVSYWVNLARAHAAAENFEAALRAAQNAVDRAPDDAAAQLALGQALVGLARHDEATTALARAETGALTNAEFLTEIADAQMTAKDFERSETNYRRALELKSGVQQAWLGLGKLLERLNRHTELLTVVDTAEVIGVPSEATALLRARALRAEGRQEEALAAARSAPETVDEIARAQLIGDIADRLGEVDTAFAAFSEANSLLAAASTEAVGEAADYLQKFVTMRELLTPEAYRSWRPLMPRPRTSPLFIFGFPRSGTTLIDTMLSGHPDAIVLEEEQTIDRTSEALGDIRLLGGLSQGELDRLTSVYFGEIDKALGETPTTRLIVDKNPLGLGSTLMLHRLFPDARFVFVERHPCDVVLSCYITSTRMNVNLASFYDFEGTARLYDRVLAYWERCCEVLPIKVHRIRYETLIAEPEPQLRALAEFAGLDWRDALLDNQASAAARSYIGSPSYAQVAEPIYTRAKGRWHRYRHHMEDVIPILKPWIERFGYEL